MLGVRKLGCAWYGTFCSILPDITVVNAGMLQSFDLDGSDAPFAPWMTGRHGRPPDWAYESGTKLGVSDASRVEQCFSVWQMRDMPPVMQNPIFFGLPFLDPGLNMQLEPICFSTTILPMHECEGIRLNRPPDSIHWSSSSDLAMNRFLIDKSGGPPDISWSSSSDLAMNRFLIDKSGRPPDIFWSSSSDLAMNRILMDKSGRPPDTSRSSFSESAMNKFLMNKSGRPPDTSRSSSSKLAMDRSLMDKSDRPPDVSWFSPSGSIMDRFRIGRSAEQPEVPGCSLSKGITVQYRVMKADRLLNFSVYSAVKSTLEKD